MNKTFPYLLSLCLCTSVLFAQETSKYDELVTKSKSLLYDNPEEALKVAKEALQISKEDRKGHANFQIANAFSYLGKLDSVNYYLDKAIADCRKTDNQNLLSGSLIFKASNQVNFGRYDSAEALFDEAKTILIAKNDTSKLVDLYLRMSNLSVGRDRFDEAMIEVEKCYNLSIQSNDIEYQTYAALQFAVIHAKIGNIEKGLEMSRTSLELAKSGDFEYTEYQAYNNIGILYKKDGQYEKALEAYLESERLAKELNFRRDLVGIYINKGSLLNLMERFSDAEEEFRKVLKVEKELGGILPRYKADILVNQADTYRHLGKNTLARKNIDEGLKLAIELESLDLQIYAYEIAKDIELATGNPLAAVEKMEVLQSLKDSLFNTEKTSQINEFQSKYEAVVKDAEINELNKKAEIQQLKNRGLWAGLILLALTAAFVIYSIISKRKKERELVAKENALELEKRRNTEIELESKKKELTTKVLQLASKNEFLSNLENEIDVLKTNMDSSVSKTSGRISRMIKRDIDNDKQWLQFSSEFSSIHGGFLSALAAKHGKFSKSEVRLVSLLKMNLSTKEIADILGISNEGVRKARYRLRKKIDIEDNEVQSYLLNFS
ncbi:tetratricopeptide repeat protein [Arcticibacterium luteifluviistationis]|uniref:Anaphase-promoting complex subunit 5 domain-containing protein n=1 Tax=Arcticibacterium luteifluviistationis TaxID=1784714 RepID=A0A2Z4GAX1_9BACT|nr:tetratricopeptide repeat protein [Arcticibacterium luteifluviistationis]AWV98366.1 hypothetical protein DJ013_09355 [Arcticibacterium luteifluviistationis]